MKKNIIPVVLFISLICTSCASTMKTFENEVAFEGISFQLPANWAAGAKRDGKSFFAIVGFDRADKETIFSIGCRSDKSWTMDEFFKRFQDSKTEIIREPVRQGKFGKYNCSLNRYQLVENDKKVNGEILIFDDKGFYVVVIKQSLHGYDVQKVKYKLIEDTFRINEVKK